MALKDKAKAIVKYAKSQCDRLKENHELYEIHEGDLLSYVDHALKCALSQKSYEQIRDRISPINVLKRLIDKLSKIYAKPPKREVLDGNDTDQQLLDYYVKEMDFNAMMTVANRMFNLHKSVAIKPYVQDGKPRLRVIPFDRYVPYSDDKIDPMHMTTFVEIMGKRLKEDARYSAGFREQELFYLYSDGEFLPVDEQGNVQTDILLELENSGENYYEKIPAIVISRSHFELIPVPDTDTKAMTVLIPLMLSDANFAIKFQAFAIIYGINLNNDGLKMGPNVFWELKSNPDFPELKPELGTIKPELDTDKVVSFLRFLLAMWMQSRNIKPGDLGSITAGDAISGVSKIIDEMDTSEDRQEQVTFFQKGERELWDFIIRHFHPYVLEQKLIDNRLAFSPGCSVLTTFPEQRPIIDRGKEVDAAQTERDAGFTTTKRAIKRLNPDMSDLEIDELITEIDEERAKNRDAGLAPNGKVIPVTPNPGAPGAGGAAGAVDPNSNLPADNGAGLDKKAPAPAVKPKAKGNG